MKWLVGVVVCAIAGALWLPGVAGAAPATGQKWAVVSSTGTLVRGNGAVAASRLGTGTYTISFASKIASCAYEAAAGDPGAGPVDDPVEVTVALLPNVPSGLLVETFDQATGALADAPFHLTTYCGAQADYAVVGSDGTIARGSHVASSTRIHVGLDDVIFDHDVSTCAFTATLGTTGAGPVANPGEVSVSRLGGGVLVQTLTRAGVTTDASFHLAVSCGGAHLNAVVKADGGTARGNNVVSSAKLVNIPHGAYEVIFNRDVTQCAYTATIGAAGRRRVITDPVTISTGSRITNPNGVFVLVTNVDGARHDEPFHLVVTC